MAGIKETGELVVWVGKVGSAVGESMEDGKLTASDILKIFKTLPDAPAALMGIAEVPTELKDLDVEEAAQLVGLFAESFAIPNHEAEHKVEMILAALSQLYAMIMGLKGL